MDLKRSQRVAQSGPSHGNVSGADVSQNRSNRSELSELIDYAELGRITRKSIVTLRRYNMAGTGPKFLRIGRHVRFRREDVLEWLNSCSAKSV